VDTPKARPVDAHAYIGRDEPELPRSVGQRVRSWLGSILAFALGVVAAEWNLTLWLVGSFAIALVLVVAGYCVRSVRRRSSQERAVERRVPSAA